MSDGKLVPRAAHYGCGDDAVYLREEQTRAPGRVFNRHDRARALKRNPALVRMNTVLSLLSVGTASNAELVLLRTLARDATAALHVDDIRLLWSADPRAVLYDIDKEIDRRICDGTF